MRTPSWKTVASECGVRVVALCVALACRAPDLLATLWNRYAASSDASLATPSPAAQAPGGVNRGNRWLLPEHQSVDAPGRREGVACETPMRRQVRQTRPFARHTTRSLMNESADETALFQALERELGGGPVQGGGSNSSRPGQRHSTPPASSPSSGLVGARDHFHRIAMGASPAAV